MIWQALQPITTPVAEDYEPRTFELPDYPPRVVFIGDSYTGGSDMGGVGEANWTVVASDELGWRDCRFAVGGSGWTRGANGWTYKARVDWAISMKPSLIVFSNGINDVRGDASLIGPAAADTLSYLRTLDADVPVVVVGPMQIQDFSALYVMNDGVAAAAAANGATYIDAIAGGWFMGDSRSYIGSDGFHPTDEGHEYLADVFVQSIQAAGITVEDTPREDEMRCEPPNPGEVAADGTPVTP